jgi:glycosyltransferase involved in cell wall biosynthesis
MRLPAPRFTVVTVCYNAAETIVETARSLKRQTCRDYEWLVVDGASNDATLELVAQAQLPNTRVVSERDKGIYDAMNKAWAMAQGQWLYFLNSGDAFADDDVLADVARAIEAQPELQLVWGDMVYVGERREWLRRYQHVTLRTLPFDDLNHQASFARRSLFERVGGFNLAFSTSADYDWFIRVLRSGALYRYLPRTIARFAVGGMHSNHPAALLAERQRLRLQYLSERQLKLGGLVARIRRRWRILRGHGG